MIIKDKNKLTEKCLNVSIKEGEKIGTQILHELRQSETGIGLAANQIGITKRFFAFGHGSFDKMKEPVIIWNPSIVRESEEKVLDEEGCLSFLGVFVKVLRPKKVTVKWQNIKGETLLNHIDGMESKCFQHELDHINGITFNQKVSKVSWEMAKKRAEKIRKKKGKS